MPSSFDSFVRLLDDCAKRLDESGTAIEEARRAVEEARELARGIVAERGSPLELRKVLNEHRVDLIASVLAALDGGAFPGQAGSLPRLALSPIDRTFRLGRRKLDLTASEAAVLELMKSVDEYIPQPERCRRVPLQSASQAEARG